MKADVAVTGRSSLVGLAYRLVETVERLVMRIRRFYYEVALSKYRCPGCGGKLAMVGESRCRCGACQRDFDPTVAFQRCTACGGQPRLRIRRYECADCGTEIDSRFVFDGLVFDADYFRQKMIEHRQRKREQSERVRQMLAECRSGAIQPLPVDLGVIPGLTEALNGLAAEGGTAFSWRPRAGFDLNRYQSHVQAHIGQIALSLEEIPPLGEDARLDRIWRFIAIIFLAHAGLIQVWQDGQDVMVMQRETNREGSDISGNLEDLDGVEGSLGRVEA